MHKAKIDIGKSRKNSSAIIVRNFNTESTMGRSFRQRINKETDLNDAIDGPKTYIQNIPNNIRTYIPLKHPWNTFEESHLLGHKTILANSVRLKSHQLFSLNTMT